MAPGSAQCGGGGDAADNTGEITLSATGDTGHVTTRDMSSLMTRDTCLCSV